MDIKRLVLLLALTVVGMGCVEVTTDSTPGDETAVRAASEQFYDALNAIFRGDLTPMEEVWSHADDVTYMGARGRGPSRLGTGSSELATAGGDEARRQGDAGRDAYRR